MNNEQISVQERSYRFAIEIVKTFQTISNDKKEFVLSKQLLRCGTSIGANTEEASGGFSRKDFKYKIGIAYKEARETKYWLNLLHDTGYIDTDRFNQLLPQCEELLKILYIILRNISDP